MKGFARLLPPFTPDVCGLSSIIERTDGIAVFDDPHSCGTCHFGIEETNRDLDVRVFVSHFSDIDLVFGTGEKLIKAADAAAEALNPAFAVFASGPITQLCWTDLEAAAEAFSRSHGIPACAVYLTGNDYYDIGLGQTMLTLGKQLIQAPQRKLPDSVNIIGLTSLDFGDRALEDIPAMFEKNGKQVVCVWGGLTDFKRMSASAEAEKNIVAAVSGIPLAKYMKKRFGIPYETAFPTFTNSVSVQADRTGDGKIVIIGEQISSNGIRTVLRRQFGYSNIEVWSFFQMSAKDQEPQDRHIEWEDQLAGLFAASRPDILIADELINRLAPESIARKIRLPHVPVSKTLLPYSKPPLYGEGLIQWLADALP